MSPILLAFAVACTTPATPAAPPAAPPEREIRFTEDADLRGMRLTLREATPPENVVDRAPLAASTPLSNADLDALFARTDALEETPGDRTPFALRPASAPPPLTGATTMEPFPPPPSPTDAPLVAAAGELHVTRKAPVGEMDVVPRVSVTFDQPMVAITSQDDASRTVPLQLSPQPPGKWRWLGTQTIQFDPDGRTGEPVGRLPASTVYTVTIPAGTTSATGGKLAEDDVFTFSTPTVRINELYPQHGPYGLEPVFSLVLDQEVDPAAVLAQVTLEGGGRAWPLRLATPAEIERDDVARIRAATTQKGRFVALHAADALPRATSFTVKVAKGLASLEGPRKTPTDETFGFFTYAPLDVVRHECGWNADCRPDRQWVIETNNPLDPTTFDPKSVVIDPPFDAVVSASGNVILISGQKDGRKRYTVTVPSGLRDTFGQTLGADEKVSFDVGPAEKTLHGPGNEMLVLEPGQAPVFPVWSVNHKSLKVEVRRVTPEDWAQWQRYLRKLNWDDARPGARPGTLVRSDVVQVAADADHLVQTPIDLAPHLQDGHGQLLVWVEPASQPARAWERQHAYAWVQVTDLGLTAFVDADEAIVWAASLATADALAGVDISLVDAPTVATGADGLGALALPAESKHDADGYPVPSVIVAKRGTDLAILPQALSWYGGGGWLAHSQLDELRWYVVDDRGLYRPGEEARVKGWIRRFEAKTGGDVQALGDAAPTAVHWTLTSSQGNPMGEGDAPISELGGFDLALSIPKEANLGQATLQLVAVGGGISSAYTTHPIAIEEFRRPEYEVTATAPEGPWSLGQEATFTVDAAYYAGGGLQGASVDWQVSASPAAYSPPGHTGYTFGRWISWWDHGYGEQVAQEGPWHLAGTTDATGRHYVAAHFQAMNPPRAMRVTAQASVTDVNRQRWTSEAGVLVHPADVYVGLKTARQFVAKGEPVDVDVVAVDPDGGWSASTVEVHAARLVEEQLAGKWETVEKDAQDCALQAAKEPGRCRFQATAGGRWRIRATARDTHGRKTETEAYFWVSGEDATPDRSMGQDRVVLVPEAQEHQPGGVARILVQAPFWPAEGTMLVERSGVVRRERIRLDGPTTTLEIPVTEDLIPGFTVQVDLVGRKAREVAGDPSPDLAPRPAFATGAVTFQVPPLARKLAVEVLPREATLAPGGKTAIALRVLDAAGKPVQGAELAVIAADESVLALTGYTLTDPLAVFYAAREAGVRTVDLRRSILLADPATVTLASGLLLPEGEAAGFFGGIGGLGVRGMGSGGGGASVVDAVGDAPVARSAAPMEARKKLKQDEYKREAGEMDKDRAEPNEQAQPTTPIAERTSFDALALFAPEVRTDAEGRATVALDLPDSLTRYRIMVVAVAGAKQFGSAEANVTARLPLMVRPSAPRFLNFGDQLELPVVLQNQTDAPMTVHVGLRATNLHFVDSMSAVLPDVPDEASSRAGRLVTVPANDRVEVRFPASTTMAGTARLQAVASAGSVADASRFEIPVWTPATTEAFATYGTTEGPTVVQPVKAPPGVWTQFGALNVQTSSTQLQALTDAVLYLQRYPYDCNEQIASRMMGIAALRDVLTAFEGPDLPSAAELEAQVAHDIGRLHDRQNYDGGFAFWRRGDESWPFLGIYVAHAYAEAELKGYDVPADAWARSQAYLRDIRSHIPYWYSAEERRYLRAYALHARWRMGDTDAPAAREILREAGDAGLSLEGHALLLPVLHAGGDKAGVAAQLRYLENRGTETAGAMSFGDTYEHGEHVLLASSRRTDGVILRGLLQVDPQSDMVPKIVKGLLAHRKKGHWGNTQEDTFILLALDAYFREYEKETPDFVARVWLGDGFAGEHAFRGRTTERSEIAIPMGYLSEKPGPQDLVIAKDGPGRLYYRIGMTYAPKDLSLEAVDRGFYVKRTYEAIDRADDVKRDADGTWRIAAGAQVRVRLVMVAPSRRYHVALVDPLPAGLEAQNPALATTGALPTDPSATNDVSPWWWWTRTWYEHENLRDDRVEAFTSLLMDGAWEYTYIARATTPGRFVVPPTKAEEMYSPETFGRSATDRVTIE